MQNWSGNQIWDPKLVHTPGSEDDIIKIVSEAAEQGASIRIIGSGHSFTPLCVTNDVLINLDGFQGVTFTDPERGHAEVRAGTKLYRLGRELDEAGLAMENLGDIDQQSIAGSTSTGTHGTGMDFGNLSTQIIEISFVNGHGKLITCSETQDPELFKCMQISLGALGIVTRIKLKCLPSYKLRLETRKEKLSTILQQIPSYNRDNRNFEFYWIPYTDYVLSKFSNLTDEPEDRNNVLSYFNDVVLENYAFKGFNELARLFPNTKTNVNKLITRFISANRKVNKSYKVYTTTRLVKFNEMEYNVPLEAYDAVIKDVIKCVNSKKFDVIFPIENRFVKKDAIFLSPAYERDSAYIACHVYKGKPYEEYFRALEEIFMAYGGRPHWGKLHYRNSNYFARVYLEWERFFRTASKA